MRPSRAAYCAQRPDICVFPGISQRDPNYYDFWNEHETQEKVATAVADFWEKHIKGKWEQTQGDCTSQSVHCVPASLNR